MEQNQRLQYVCPAPSSLTRKVCAAVYVAVFVAVYVAVCVTVCVDVYNVSILFSVLSLSKSTAVCLYTLISRVSRVRAYMSACVCL